VDSPRSTPQPPPPSPWASVLAALTGFGAPGGEQTYLSGPEEWMMRADPDLIERYRSGRMDPYMELDLDRPSAWALRNVMPTQPVSFALPPASLPAPAPPDWLRLLAPILTAI
jgi:hypothetical protein